MAQPSATAAAAAAPPPSPPPPHAQEEKPKQGRAQAQEHEQAKAQGMPHAQPGDGRSFYGYLFQPDKQPTKVLDGLLRGLAEYISENIGDKDEKSLTPAKMAEFYKAVGGNYDSFFVSIPSPSISWIYASIGCQHTLQPTPSNDYLLPTIPALTTRGFVRWQSIEILLGPEEHVPFLQTAVRDFRIRNPVDGTRFPVDLPSEAFPARADEDIERWHQQCAEKLRQRATPDGEHGGKHRRNADDEGPDITARPRPRPIPRQKTSLQGAFAHVRPTARPARSEPDHSEPKSRAGGIPGRPLSYHHITPGGDGRGGGESASRPVRPKLSQDPNHRARQFLAPEDTAARGRRRSYPDGSGSASAASTSPVPDARVPVGGVFGHPQTHHGHAQPQMKPHAQQRDSGSRERRHSHPRPARRGSVSSDASSEDESPSSPSPPRRSHLHSHPHVNVADIMAGIRFAVPPAERRARADGPLPVDARRKSRERDREREKERGKDDDLHSGWDRYRQRERERRDLEDAERRHKERDPDEAKKTPAAVFGFPIPVDITGRLSRQFLGTGTKRDSGSRSGSHGRVHSGPSDGTGTGNGGASVKWKDRDELAMQEARRRGDRGSRSQEDERRRGERDRERDFLPPRYSGRDERSRERERDRERERERERERDSGGSSRSDQRRRERDRERDRERERDRDRERERDRDRERERERDRERHRASDPPKPRFQRRGSSLEDFSRLNRRMPSPGPAAGAGTGTGTVRGINGRRYPTPTVSSEGGR